MQERQLQFTPALQCGACSNTSAMVIVVSWEQSLNTGEMGAYGYELKAGFVWEMALCPACGTMNLVGHSWREYEDPEENPIDPGVPDEYRSSPIVEETRPVVLFPTTAKPLSDIPPQIDREYRAALRVRNLDPNAYAVLVGRVMEAAASDLGGVGRDLYHRVEDLAAKGELPQRLAQLVHMLRKLRNIGAHETLGSISKSDVNVLDDLCRIVLEYAYVAPKLVDSVEQRLQQIEYRE